MIHPRLLKKAQPLEWVALFLFGIYLVWNFNFIANAQIPPSIFIFITDLPCPSTGCTRATIALVNGNIIQSLILNPVTIIYIMLLFLTFFSLIYKKYNKQNIILDSWLSKAWLFSLLFGWIFKLGTI